MKKQSLHYSAVPTVILALAAVASLGTVVDLTTTAALCGRPALLLTTEPNHGSVARSASSRLAEAARRFSGQTATLPVSNQFLGVVIPAVAIALPPTDVHQPYGLCLVNPRLTNLPPPLA